MRRTRSKVRSLPIRNVRHSAVIRPLTSRFFSKSEENERRDRSDNVGSRNTVRGEFLVRESAEPSTFSVERSRPRLARRRIATNGRRTPKRKMIPGPPSPRAEESIGRPELPIGCSEFDDGPFRGKRPDPLRPPRVISCFFFSMGGILILLLLL